ncbi:class II histocompatibility antigen, B-L beta chain-like isoform X4 [Pseudopipra pipra]|uniref:class II histocompatibility antigen, B-L beta chain-like isoform X4 n=1 Tax=Pseudopipra pipra TaxID=415032 RepID=UPI00313953F7
MERVRGAGAVLAVLVVLGAPPAVGEELSGVFQWMGKQECHFINSTEEVRFLERHFYNREQLLHFDSDVGVYVGDTPFGEIQARDYNSHREYLKYKRGQVDTYCRSNYKLGTPFSVERRGEVVPGWAGAAGARGGHRRGPQRGLELPGAGDAGNPPPARGHLQLPEMPPDTVRSKILVGVGGFVLGLVFLALGLGFYLWEKSS